VGVLALIVSVVQYQLRICMKNSSSAVQGFCAGAVMVLALLAFAVGATERPGASTMANATVVIGVTIHPTPSPQMVAYIASSDLPQARAAPARVGPSWEAEGTPGSIKPAKTFRCPKVTSTTFATIGSRSGCDGEQKEIDVSDKMQCAIPRDSCEFGFLAGNLDPALMFLDDEPPPLNDEDHLMHPALLRPLARLRDLVAETLPGNFTLMIVDAYDSTGTATGDGLETINKYGLQYEGRAVEFRTVPVSATLTGALCWLALESKFDYAENRGDKCYASLRAPSLCRICSNASSMPVSTPLPSAMATSALMSTPPPAPTPDMAATLDALPIVTAVATSDGTLTPTTTVTTTASP